MKKILLVASLLALPVYAQNVATVNGVNITNKEFEEITNVIAKGNKLTEEQKKGILEDLVTREVLIQEAKKQKIDQDPAVAKQIEFSRDQILTTALLSKYIEKNPVKEEDIKKLYDSQIKALGNIKQYNVRHILVKDEARAKEIYEQLNEKKIDFAETAKKESIDHGTASGGGVLGWHPASNFVPQFGKAVEEAKISVLTQPVKSDFGYHLIMVDDVRPTPLPSYEASKREIVSALSLEKVNKYTEELKKKAKIKTNLK